MKTIRINPDSIISMNDYPPLHSPEALKRYYDIFRTGKLNEITPIPVIPVVIVVPYLQKQDERFRTYSDKLRLFLQEHPHAKYLMFDGTHRAAAATLSSNKIPSYLIRTDKDVKELEELRKKRKLSISGLKDNLPETMDIIEEHYHRTKKFWTLEEKVKSMISHGDIDKSMLEQYTHKKK